MFNQYSIIGSSGRNIPGGEQLQNQIFPVLQKRNPKGMAMGINILVTVGIITVK